MWNQNGTLSSTARASAGAASISSRSATARSAGVGTAIGCAFAYAQRSLLTGRRQCCASTEDNHSRVGFKHTVRTAGLMGRARAAIEVAGSAR